MRLSNGNWARKCYPILPVREGKKGTIEHLGKFELRSHEEEAFDLIEER